MQIVVVVVNRLKPFTHASPRLLGNHYGAVVRGFFHFCYPTVLHTIVRLNPEGVEEKGTRYA